MEMNKLASSLVQHHFNQLNPFCLVGHKHFKSLSISALRSSLSSNITILLKKLLPKCTQRLNITNVQIIHRNEMFSV